MIAKINSHKHKSPIKKSGFLIGNLSIMITDVNTSSDEFGWRQYDPLIARWHATDPAEQFANPYLAMGNSPTSFVDYDGAQGGSGGTSGTTDLEHSGYSYGSASDLGYNSGYDMYMAMHYGGGWGSGYMTSSGGTGLGIGADGKGVTFTRYGVTSGDGTEYSTWDVNTAQDIKAALTDYAMQSGNYGYSLPPVSIEDLRINPGATQQWAYDNIPEYAGNSSQCPNCLDPATVNRNWLHSYMGPNNPLTYSRRPDYSTPPVTLSEIPAIVHDKYYDSHNAAGSMDVLLNQAVISADWRFVGSELSLAINPFLDMSTRLEGFASGAVLGTVALPKTIYNFSTINARIRYHKY